MPQLLLEGERGAVPFIVDRKTSFVQESRDGVPFTRIPGRFSICDSVNGNNRRYPKKVWEKNLSEGSLLKQAIAKNAAFGVLEHPKDGQISLQSPICILVTDAKLKPTFSSEGKTIDEVVGEIVVLNTPEGHKLRSLIEAGYNPLVSSRGFGSVVRASDGVDEVQEDYICEGWDPVLKPSFETAELQPNRESKLEAKPSVEKALAENQAPLPASTPLANNLSPAASSPETVPALRAGTNQPLTETITTMDLNTIKSRIGAHAGVKTPANPARFAEGMNEMALLHQEIANYVAEDAKRSWQGQQLHEELRRVEAVWSEAATAPTKQAARLTENHIKTLRVTKMLGEAAVGLKKKLTEALSQNAEATSLIEELTERGQAWVGVAGRHKAKTADLDHKLEVACEALDIMAARYRQDMTDTGRHIITLEFAEKAQTPDIQKLLKEAKTPKDVIAIREVLEGKKPAAEIKEGKDGKPAPAAQLEGKPAPAAAPAAKLETTPALEEARVLVPSVHSITESVAMVQRLSAATAK